MADSPQWRGRLTDWRERLYDWVCNPEPQQVRTSSIFFDFTAIYGEAALAQQLRELVQEQVTGQPGFLYQMMALDLRYKVPVGLLVITSYSIHYTKLYDQYREQIATKVSQQLGLPVSIGQARLEFREAGVACRFSTVTIGSPQTDQELRNNFV